MTPKPRRFIARRRGHSRLLERVAHRGLGQQRQRIDEVAGVGRLAQQERDLRAPEHDAVPPRRPQRAARGARRRGVRRTLLPFRHRADAAIQPRLQRRIDRRALKPPLLERIEIDARRPVEPDHPRPGPAPAGDLVRREVDHAQHRAARRGADRADTEVRAVAGDDDEIDHLAQPRGGVDELRVDLHRDDRAAVAAHAHRQPAVYQTTIGG
jgi:hypothetical protein